VDSFESFSFVSSGEARIDVGSATDVGSLASFSLISSGVGMFVVVSAGFAASGSLGLRARLRQQCIIGRMQYA